MRGSLNLILESHQPQTREEDIYHAYEKNSDTSLLSARRYGVGWGGRNEQSSTEEQSSDGAKERKAFNGRE